MDHWYVLIGIVAVLAWAAVAIVSLLRSGRKGRMSEALESNTELNRQVAARLEQIDARLAAVEKTLNEIP